MASLLGYDFFQYAVLAGALASVACGIIGSFVVSKRLVSIAGGIAHASFGGVGIGYLLGTSPLWSAVAFGVLSSAAISFLSRKTRVREDVAIGIIWSAGMSIGIVCIGLYHGTVPDLFTYLFGNILAVTVVDIVALLVLDTVLLVVLWLFGKELIAVSFDEEFCAVRGIPVALLSAGLLVAISVGVVLLMKIVGLILVIALLAIPAATSGMLTQTFGGMTKLSIGVNLLCICTGLVCSYYFDVPSGAAIILTALVIFLATVVIRRVSGVGRT